MPWSCPPIGLARRFRELAGFTDTEVEDIAEMSLKALEERKAFAAAALAGDTTADPA